LRAVAALDPDRMAAAPPEETLKAEELETYLHKVLHQVGHRP